MARISVSGTAITRVPAPGRGPTAWTRKPLPPLEERAENVTEPMPPVVDPGSAGGQHGDGAVVRVVPERVAPHDGARRIEQRRVASGRDPPETGCGSSGIGNPPPGSSAVTAASGHLCDLLVDPLEQRRRQRAVCDDVGDQQPERDEPDRDEQQPRAQRHSGRLRWAKHVPDAADRVQQAAARRACAAGRRCRSRRSTRRRRSRSARRGPRSAPSTAPDAGSARSSGAERTPSASGRSPRRRGTPRAPSRPSRGRRA